MFSQFNYLCREATLYHAWNYVKSKGSAGGIETYDISDDKRRNKVIKLMESVGTRMNYSVFECMLTDIQYKSMCERLAKIVVKREDWVNIYPLCTECYARIEYIPPVKKKDPVKIVVV